jgi:hypothetical protein
VTSVRDRAVVLGGGGVAGIGWQLGLLSGLAEVGLDVRLDTGLFIGTSAGATVVGADRYIDGGARSHTNADFAAGCDPVLVVLPLEPGGRIAAVLDRELAELRASAEVLLVRMDEHGRSAMGNNPLDPSTRHAMVAAGRAQAGDIANEVAALWK